MQGYAEVTPARKWSIDHVSEEESSKERKQDVTQNRALKCSTAIQKA